MPIRAEFNVVCDGCAIWLGEEDGEDEVFDEHTEAVEAARAADWEVVRDNVLCPTCIKRREKKT